MAPAEIPVSTLIDECRHLVRTPYYLIDEGRMLGNLEKIAALRARSGAKSVLALKCFSTWSVFPTIRQYLDGTTASSVYEARLGHEKFGKEVHVYSVGFSPEDIQALRPYATMIIFNSVSQLRRFHAELKDIPLGMRINPGVSHSEYGLADPARPHSRLGVIHEAEIESVSGLINGLMFHCNCENNSFESFNSILEVIARRFGSLIQKMAWVSLGGGIAFTGAEYPFDSFCEAIRRFADRFQVQVYLEPGEAVVAGSGFLVTTVLDVVNNGLDIAIVDAGVETHMLDVLIYNMTAKLEGGNAGDHTCVIAGRTCLAGDVFGTYRLPTKLCAGSVIAFADAAGYTMVKKNWFNGLPMPSIVVRRVNGEIEVVREFNYDEYLRSLS